MVINIDDESPPSFENNEYQWPGDCVKNTFDMYCDVISVLGPFDEDDQCHKDTGCTEQGVEVYATSPGTNHCSTREERNVDGQYDWMGGVPDDENVANNDDNRNSDISGGRCVTHDFDTKKMKVEGEMTAPPPIFFPEKTLYLLWFSVSHEKALPLFRNAYFLFLIPYTIFSTSLFLSPFPFLIAIH